MNKALIALVLSAVVMSVLACEDHVTTDTTSSTTVPSVDVSANVNVNLGPTSYPVRLGYINKISHWYGDAIAGDLGTPGIASPHDYNYMALAFWRCKGDPLDIALLWQNAYSYFGAQSSLGSTNH